MRFLSGTRKRERRYSHHAWDCLVCRLPAWPQMCFSSLPTPFKSAPAGAQMSNVQRSTFWRTRPGPGPAVGTRWWPDGEDPAESSPGKKLPVAYWRRFLPLDQALHENVQKRAKPARRHCRILVRVDFVGALTMFQKPKTENCELVRSGTPQQVLLWSPKGVTTLRRYPEDLSGVRRVPAH